MHLYGCNRDCQRMPERYLYLQQRRDHLLVAMRSGFNVHDRETCIRDPDQLSPSFSCMHSEEGR